MPRAKTFVSMPPEDPTPQQCLPVLKSIRTRKPLTKSHVNVWYTKCPNHNGGAHMSTNPPKNLHVDMWHRVQHWFRKVASFHNTPSKSCLTCAQTRKWWPLQVRRKMQTGNPPSAATCTLHKKPASSPLQTQIGRNKNPAIRGGPQTVAQRNPTERPARRQSSQPNGAAQRRRPSPTRVEPGRLEEPPTGQEWRETPQSSRRIDRASRSAGQRSAGDHPHRKIRGQERPLWEWPGSRRPPAGQRGGSEARWEEWRREASRKKNLQVQPREFTQGLGMASGGQTAESS